MWVGEVDGGHLSIVLQRCLASTVVETLVFPAEMLLSSVTSVTSFC